METLMIPPLKPGATLAQLRGSVIETGRLILRPWRDTDIAPNSAMLADPGTARYIAADGKPVTTELAGWRNAAVMSGHWALHGFGMFVVEEKSSGQFVGRVEAAGAAIDWVFVTFELDEIGHCIDCENTASQAVARRLGAEKGQRIDLFGHAADLWVTKRDAWGR
jgi:RimJ/RimL family protein N-acetyltransferase